MKNFAIICFIFAAASPLFATDPQPSYDSKPIYGSYGNVGREINVRQSTTVPVLISSAALGATGVITDTQALTINAWMFREIVNTSTCSALALYSGGHRYATYTSSFGVVLASGSLNSGLGDAYVVPHQDSIWALWSPNATCTNGAGAGGIETFYEDNKRR